MNFTVDDLMRKAHDDPKYIIESGFWVVSKEKQPVPFIFKHLQNEFYEQRSIRDDILKGSQLGFSSMILAILTVKFLLVPNCWCVCISHEAEATKRLFDKVDFFLTHLPKWLQQFYQPSTDSEKNLVNGVMRSKFYIGTAGARAFGRGDTIHYAHLSEVSRWPDSKIATGIIRAVPINDPHTWIVKETTANGQGIWHHLEWQREKEGRSAFRPYFALWLKDETCRIPGTKINPETLDETEKLIPKRFPDLANDETLEFRRRMINTLQSEHGYTPEEIFKQEFPLDDTEAFLYTGNPVFPVEQLEEYKAEVRLPIFVGNLVGVSPNENLDETPKGWLKLWDMPTVDGQYIIFADVGQFSDFCSAHVVNRKTWKTVAHFHAPIKAHQFGDELYSLGYFFNKALIAVEVNSMGQSTVDRLVTLRYPSLYMRERLNEKEKKITKEYGWYTTEKTKSRMIGYLQDLVRTKQADLPDIDTIMEMSTFIKKDDGAMGASEGNKDDRVISQSGAYYILKLHPYIEPVSSKPPPSEVKVKKYRAFRSASRLRSFRNH